jgi:hypothetical protein
MVETSHSALPLEPKLARYMQAYVAGRDKLKKMEEAYKVSIAKDKETMNMIEGYLLKFLEQTGGDNMKTPYGTFFKTTKHTASLEDPKAFLNFVIAGAHWDLIDKKANVTAVMAFLEENKELPPGVKLSSKLDVNVRRPSDK